MPSADSPATVTRVLVVDDSPVNLLLAEAMLRDRGLDVDTASSARDALSRAHAVSYALILLDVRMAEVDGITTARQIRALGGYNSGVPIVAVTADADFRTREACLAAGMDEFVVKPLEMGTLDGVLDRWCGPSLPARPAPAETPKEDVPPDVDAVVFARLRAGITPETFRQLVSRFSSEAPLRIVRMRAAAAFHDHDLVGREAHALKSTAALFGAHRLVAAAVDIERMALQREDCAGLIVELASLGDAVGAWLDQALAQAPGAPEPDGTNGTANGIV